MTSIKSTNTLKIYEINGEGEKVEQQCLTVKNHWNRRELVVLEYQGEEITMDASDLMEAIQNAQNCHRL